MSEKRWECLRPFFYDGKQLEIGDEWIPVGGKWDHKIMNPDNLYVREVVDMDDILDSPDQEIEISTDPIYLCVDCGREFSSSRGLKTHSRYCKGKE